MAIASNPPRRHSRVIALARALYLAGLLLRASSGTAETQPDVTQAKQAHTAPQRRFSIHAAWPEGITYEFRKATPALKNAGPLSPFEDVYLLGRVGARLDIDAAAFAADASLSDFRDGAKVRRARFYLLGDFRFGLQLAYKLQFSVEGRRALLNDFYLRWKPRRWVDSVDLGYFRPPMGLENVASSRSRTLMEMGSPEQALAPGYRSGIAVAGHWEPWRTAWKAGFFSVGQEQLTGDASRTSTQFVGRVAWVPWRESAEPGAAFFHLGLSMSDAFSGNTIRYRARPESFIAPYVVDTGAMGAGNAFQYGLEGAWADGPLLISSEVLRSHVAVAQGRDADLGGAYGLLSWVLTGEPHPYDANRGLFQRLQPRRPFSFCGGGWGALEIGQRLSWIDLSDGSAHGGEMLSLTSGVTWHLNAQLRLFANYVFAHVTGGPQTGDVNVFQARIEIGI
jgi:phosphate-selective porin